MSSHVHRKISRVAWLLVLVVLSCIWIVSKRRADTFVFDSQWLRTNALNVVSSNSVVNSYRSKRTTEHYEIWRVKKSFSADELYQKKLQIILVGKRLYRCPIEFKQSGPGKFKIVTSFGQKN
jgi:hypothetical protein